MNEKKIAKTISPVFAALYFDKLMKPFLGGKGHILMLHRIAPKSDIPRIHNHESLEITPEHLELIIQYFKSLHYNFISLDQLYSQLQSGNINTPFVVFTFDDGYKDNLECAYPIFKKHNIPFTIYITTSFPDYTSIIWWYMLEDYLIQNKKISFTSEGVQYSFEFEEISKKEYVFNKIRRIFIQKAEKDLPEFTQKVFQISGDEIKNMTKKFCLSWDEIRTLSNDPLVTIGAHTVNHVGLLTRSAAEAKFEINESKRIIESHIGKPVKHFSYPFGSQKEAGIREFQMAKDAGFLTACTTRLGNIFIQHREYTTALPRISINSLTTMNVLKMQTSGLLPLLRNKFRRIVIP
jgi:peptidoglycan/xylan/chitin deacetylase (PgdA/CDA1 family)